MNNGRGSWETLPFERVISDESGGSLKTLQSEFLSEGLYPIVDQGKSLIAGFSNDSQRLCSVELPVVIFGDHTRAFKYIDFPFCIGADGVKVLRPKVDAHVKYLFHYFQQLQLTHGGYDRHFKYLKRVEIPLPSLEEQKRIADTLDATDALRAKRRRALARLDDLARSLFLHHFGDPDSIFKKWPTKSLGEVLDFLTSGSRGWAQYYAETGDLFLRIQNVRRDQLDLADIAYVNAPNTAESKRTRVEPGDVLLSITADLGRTAVIPDDIGTAFISQHLSILRTKALVPRFLSAYLSSPAGQRQVFGRNRQAVKAGLNFDDIRSFTIPIPPLDLQRRFAAEIAVVESLKAQHRAGLARLDTLFASLQDRAFSGKL